ncbi:hypothetical protein [Streptomyces sp. NPDC058964]|uniref:hypothetical protein n=1 Tax=Streptomyces sp. NPDC058964 TaxID=3346681 RepID=UPI0036B39997
MSTAWHSELRQERSRFMETIGELTDDEIQNARTLCAPRTPRDVLAHVAGLGRGLGRNREIPGTVARALFREGVIWSWPFGRKLTRYRVIPSTPGGGRRGRGQVVRGTTEALSMWLAGRGASPMNSPSIRSTTCERLQLHVC